MGCLNNLNVENICSGFASSTLIWCFSFTEPDGESSINKQKRDVHTSSLLELYHRQPWLTSIVPELLLFIISHAKISGRHSNPTSVIYLIWPYFCSQLLESKLSVVILADSWKCFQNLQLRLFAGSPSHPAIVCHYS